MSERIVVRVQVSHPSLWIWNYRRIPTVLRRPGMPVHVHHQMVERERVVSVTVQHVCHDILSDRWNAHAVYPVPRPPHPKSGQRRHIHSPCDQSKVFQGISVTMSVREQILIATRGVCLRRRLPPRPVRGGRVRALCCPQGRLCVID